MVNQKIVEKYAECGTFHKGSAEYKELDEMTDIQITKLQIELEKQGLFLTYNNVNDCYCIN